MPRGPEQARRDFGEVPRKTPAASLMFSISRVRDLETFPQWRLINAMTATRRPPLWEAFVRMVSAYTTQRATPGNGPRIAGTRPISMPRTMAVRGLPTGAAHSGSCEVGPGSASRALCAPAIAARSIRTPAFIAMAFESHCPDPVRSPPQPRLRSAHRAPP